MTVSVTALNQNPSAEKLSKPSLLSSATLFMHADIFYDIRLDDVTYANSMIFLPPATTAVKWESGNVLWIAREV